MTFKPRHRRSLSSVDSTEMPDFDEALRKEENFARLAVQASTDQERDRYLNLEQRGGA